MGLLDGVQRALEPIDDLALEVTDVSRLSFRSTGTLGPVKASKPKLAMAMCM